MNDLEKIDEEILKLIKSREEKAIFDNQYLETDINTIIQKCQTYNLNPSFIKKLFTSLNNETLNVFQQNNLKKQNNNWCVNYKSASYLGPKGTYSYQALIRFCEKYNIKLNEVPCTNFKDQVNNVKHGISDLAFLPIENTSSGNINDVYDLMGDKDVSIISEITLPIVHSLLVFDSNATKSTITKIYSHPQPIAQCSNFLDIHFPNAKFVYCDSTADAIKQVKNINDNTVAAIGSNFGGKLFGLRSIISNIANQTENFTRFVVIAKNSIKVPIDMPAKTSITFTLPNKPGSLAQILEVFKKHNYNLIKLASRPIIGSPWKELFYADFQANLETISAQKAIDELKRSCTEFNVLGCYPQEQQEEILERKKLSI